MCFTSQIIYNITFALSHLPTNLFCGRGDQASTALPGRPIRLLGEYRWIHILMRHILTQALHKHAYELRTRHRGEPHRRFNKLCVSRQSFTARDYVVVDGCYDDDDPQEVAIVYQIGHTLRQTRNRIQRAMSHIYNSTATHELFV